MTSTIVIPTLETDRLILRAPRLGDRDGFMAFLMSERSQYVGGPIADKGVASRAFGSMAGQWVLRGFGPLVWQTKADGRAIGHGGPWQLPHLPSPEMGWCLWSNEVERQGYAIEAMTEILVWTRNTAKLTGLWSGIEPENRASMRLAEKLGGIRAAIDRTPEGEDVPCFHYPAVTA